jgi:hypothetical protein
MIILHCTAAHLPKHQTLSSRNFLLLLLLES